MNNQRKLSAKTIPSIPEQNIKNSVIQLSVLNLYSKIDLFTEMKFLECIEYLFFLKSSFAATSKHIETSFPLIKPDYFMDDTIKSNA